jgi:hypothetical protein
MLMKKMVGSKRVAALLVVMGMLVASNAQAAFFTLLADVPLGGGGSLGGAFGNVERETDFAGVADALQRDGTIDWANQDILVVRVTLAAVSAPVDQVGIAAFSTPFVGNPVGVSLFDIDTGQAADGFNASPFVLIAGVFDFGFGVGGAANLEQGETSYRLAVSFGPAGALAVGNNANFMISSGTDFTVQGPIIPEPATGLLVAGGLVGLGLVRRRRS